MLLIDLNYLDPDPPRQLDGTWIGMTLLVLGLLFILLMGVNGVLMTIGNEDFENRLFFAVETYFVLLFIGLICVALSFGDQKLASDMSKRRIEAHTVALAAKNVQVRAALEEKYGISILDDFDLPRDGTTYLTGQVLEIAVEPLAPEILECFIQVTANHYEIACHTDPAEEPVQLAPRT